MPDLHLNIIGHLIPIHEIDKSFSHSSGHGGQNVNKTSTKVHLRLNINELHDLPEDLKQKLKQKFGAGHILAESQETRSQHKNLELALKHLQRQIDEALHEDPERKESKPKHRTRIGKWFKMKKDKWLKWKYRANHPDY